MSWHTLHDILQTLALLGTPVGLGFTVYQLALNRRQAITQFEDTLASEYRAIVGRLPLDTFHGVWRAAELEADEKRAMLQYFDLSNEQLRLVESGTRISDEAATTWGDGIRDNMRLPAFQRAWDELARELPEGYFTRMQAEVAKLKQQANWRDRSIGPAPAPEPLASEVRIRPG